MVDYKVSKLATAPGRDHLLYSDVAIIVAGPTRSPAACRQTKRTTAREISILDSGVIRKSSRPIILEVSHVGRSA
jgi:hypothetical protein